MKPTNTNTPPRLFVAVEVAERHLSKIMYSYGEAGNQMGRIARDPNTGYFYCAENKEIITHVLEPLTPSTDTIEQAADNFIQDSIKHRFPEGFEHNTIYLYDEWIKRIAEFATSPAAGAYWLGKQPKNIPMMERKKDGYFVQVHRFIGAENNFKYEITFNKSLEHTGKYTAIEFALDNYEELEKLGFKIPTSTDVEHPEIPELTETMYKYIQLLTDEITELASHVTARTGWQSKRVSDGERLRNKIEELRKRQPQNDVKKDDQKQFNTAVGFMIGVEFMAFDMGMPTVARNMVKEAGFGKEILEKAIDEHSSDHMKQKLKMIVRFALNPNKTK